MDKKESLKQDFINKWKHMPAWSVDGNFSTIDGEPMITEELDMLLDKIKRIETIEFAYACAFLIDECSSIEDVVVVYDNWRKHIRLRIKDE
jgi:hypothetical protein